MDYSPKLEKLEKTLGKQTVEDMEKLDTETLKKRIIQANQAMQETKEELEALPAYRKAKDDLKDLSAGKRDVDKRQKAVIQLALMLITDKGEATLPPTLFELEQEAAQRKAEAAKRTAANAKASKTKDAEQ